MKLFLPVVMILVVLGGFSFVTEYFAYYQPVLRALPSSQGFIDVMDVARMAVQAFSLLLGLVCGFFYERFRDLEKRGSSRVRITEEAKRMLTSPRFFAALAASPVVYTIVIAAAQGAPLLVSGVFALQNGFFWKTVLPERPQLPIPPK